MVPNESGAKTIRSGLFLFQSWFDLQELPPHLVCIDVDCEARVNKGNRGSSGAEICVVDVDDDDDDNDPLDEGDAVFSRPVPWVGG